MTRAKLVLLAAFAAALIALAGCGGDDSGDTTVTVDSAATDTATTSDQAPLSSKTFNPAEIYKRDAPAVVTILSIIDSSGGLGGGAQGGQGSGFIISKDGEIVTNAHVVTTGGSGAEAGGGPIREAKEIYVELADHNRVPAEIVGIDPDADVALIKIEPDGLELHTVALADGKGIEVGQPVAAIGSPFGEEQSLSVGVVSATDRTIPSLTNFSIDGAIQTDASINPGNSGGPLLNAAGEVIGINQQIESQSGSNAGVGFAVPITAVRYSLDQLRDDGKVDYAFIGVTTQSVYPQLASELGIDATSGALISKVEPGSPAAKAGLKGGDKNIRFQAQSVRTGGDVIVAIDGEKVTSSSDVARLVADRHPGEKLTFEVIRDGDHQNVEVTLGTRPSSAG